MSNASAPFKIKIWDQSFTTMQGELIDYTDLGFNYGLNGSGAFSFKTTWNGRVIGNSQSFDNVSDAGVFDNNDPKIITIHENFGTASSGGLNDLQEVFRGVLEDETQEVYSSKERDLTLGGRDISAMLEFVSVWPPFLGNGDGERSAENTGTFDPPERAFTGASINTILNTLLTEALNTATYNDSVANLFDGTNPFIFQGTLPSIDATVDIGTSIMDLLNGFVQGGYLNWCYLPQPTGTPSGTKAQVKVFAFGEYNDKPTTIITATDQVSITRRRYRRNIFTGVVVVGDNGVWVSRRPHDAVRNANQRASFGGREATIKQDGTTNLTILQTVGDSFIAKSDHLLEEWIVTAPYLPYQDQGGLLQRHKPGDRVLLDRGFGSPLQLLVTSVAYQSGKNFGKLTITLGDPVTKRLIELNRDVKRLLSGTQGV